MRYRTLSALYLATFAGLAACRKQGDTITNSRAGSTAAATSAAQSQDPLTLNFQISDQGNTGALALASAPSGAPTVTFAVTSITFNGANGKTATKSAASSIQLATGDAELATCTLSKIIITASNGTTYTQQIGTVDFNNNGFPTKLFATDAIGEAVLAPSGVQAYLQLTGMTEHRSGNVANIELQVSEVIESLNVGNIAASVTPASTTSVSDGVTVTVSETNVNPPIVLQQVLFTPAAVDSLGVATKGALLIALLASNGVTPVASNFDGQGSTALASGKSGTWTTTVALTAPEDAGGQFQFLVSGMDSNTHPVAYNYTISIPASVASVPTASAAFTGQDLVTEGSWQGQYGADGYSLEGDQTKYPSYAQVAVSGASTYTWASSTNDENALQTLAKPDQRIAACWYADNNFTVDLKLADGLPHDVSLYLVDFDSRSRGETIQVLNGDTGDVFDTRTAANFVSGTYLSWKISGHVQFKVAMTSGANAVLSGLFFDPPSAANAKHANPGSVAFVGADTKTAGSWPAVYGADGYAVATGASALPPYAALGIYSDQSYVWAAATTDARALRQAADTTSGLASCWYSASKFAIDLAVTDGGGHNISLYLVDWDGRARGERIDVVDAESGTVLDSQTAASFVGGVYLTWAVKGHVRFVVTNTGPVNAVVSGVFFDHHGSS